MNKGNKSGDEGEGEQGRTSWKGGGARGKAGD